MRKVLALSNPKDTAPLYLDQVIDQVQVFQDFFGAGNIFYNFTMNNYNDLPNDEDHSLFIFVGHYDHATMQIRHNLEKYDANNARNFVGFLDGARYRNLVFLGCNTHNIFEIATPGRYSTLITTNQDIVVDQMTPFLIDFINALIQRNCNVSEAFNSIPPHEYAFMELHEGRYKSQQQNQNAQVNNVTFYTLSSQLIRNKFPLPVAVRGLLMRIDQEYDHPTYDGYLQNIQAAALRSDEVFNRLVNELLQQGENQAEIDELIRLRDLENLPNQPRSWSLWKYIIIFPFILIIVLVFNDLFSDKEDYVCLKDIEQLEKAPHKVKLMKDQSDVSKCFVVIEKKDNELGVDKFGNAKYYLPAALLLKETKTDDLKAVIKGLHYLRLKGSLEDGLKFGDDEDNNVKLFFGYYSDRITNKPTKEKCRDNGKWSYLLCEYFRTKYLLEKTDSKDVSISSLKAFKGKVENYLDLNHSIQHLIRKFCIKHSFRDCLCYELGRVEVVEQNEANVTIKVDEFCIEKSDFTNTSEEFKKKQDGKTSKDQCSLDKK